ncbi:hypothetical protein HPB50_017457 [Hyalomma asiaticum]|uniref:Uncharacterized protein n=1 Tax=Hyalomma asiaticum TaxID=266040 RepID=A0ACB7RJ79_HYAAI|nr:hypothetical protein HPB50_017457 [Hyalomma asiaticum]
MKGSAEPVFGGVLSKHLVTRGQAYGRFRLPRGYGFLDFGDEEAAERALLRCNGKPIPNAMQPKMFRLNHANNSTGGGGGGGGGYQQGYANGGGRPQYGSSSNELSMFVGDLSADVDDGLLYQAFSQRYPSVRAAKGEKRLCSGLQHISTTMLS